MVELSRALERRAPERISAYLLNPDLAVPSTIEPLIASGKVRFVDDADVYAEGAVVHVASPVELALPLDRLLPPAARAAGVRVCTTVFDLIPMSMPDVYLQDPGLRRRYLARTELLRGADAVLTISRYVADDVHTRLGVDRRRITTIPLVPSATFRPPASRDAALRSALSSVAGLRARFVLCTGGSDGRKNLEGLLAGWAELPVDVQRSWQLVVAGSLPPLFRNHLEVMAAAAGFADGFLCTGYVDDATLVALNQSAGLFVFPSLAEGFGFPVAEALVCGTPAISGDNTSLVELLPDEARFDATSPIAMAAAIRRALTDEALRRRILAAGDTGRRRTWDDVADETIAAYERIPFRARSAVPATPERAKNGGRARWAFVSPLPPQPGGVAAYSERLLAALRRRGDVMVDAYVDGPPHQRSAILAAADARPLGALERTEAFSGPYDAVVYNVGNSEFHTGALAMLQRRPGVVLAHDVRLTNLYRFARWQHPDAVPDDVDPDADEALLARHVVAASTRFVTTSGFAADLARLDARREHRHRVVAIPFAVDDGSIQIGRDEGGGAPVVTSFGVLNPSKQGPLIVAAVAALARDDVRLVFVGPAGDDDAASVIAAAQREGLTGQIEVTGHVDRAEYRRRLAEATIAVQLRASTNGESSAAIGDCLTSGLPTIVTDIGANRALPRDAVLPVAVDVDVDGLSTALGGVLDDDRRRRALSRGARVYAEAHTFDAAADALYRVVSSPA